MTKAPCATTARCVFCPSHASRICNGDAVYWADGCGRTEELIETCGSGSICESGSCTSCELDCSSAGFTYTCDSDSSASHEHYEYDEQGNVVSMTWDVEYSNGREVHCVYEGSSLSTGSCEDDTGATCSF